MFQAAYGRPVELRRPRRAPSRRSSARWSSSTRRSIASSPATRAPSPPRRQRGLGAVQRQGALHDLPRAQPRRTRSAPTIASTTSACRRATRTSRSSRSKALRRAGEGRQSTRTHRRARARDRPLRARPLPGHRATAPTSARFKTSQLRNIGITGPYMHDGSMQTLWDVMDHYNKGGEANPFLDGGIEPLALTETRDRRRSSRSCSRSPTSASPPSNAAEMARQRAVAAKQRPFRDERRWRCGRRCRSRAA